MPRTIQKKLINHPLKVLRRKMGFSTQRELAEATGIPHPTVKMIEAGQRSMGALQQSRIAAKLNLVFDTEEQQWVTPNERHTFYCRSCGGVNLT